MGCDGCGKQGREPRHCAVPADILAPLPTPTPSRPPASQVWDVLLDFERLPSFLPNLTACQVVARPHVGRLQVLQRGSAHSFLWHLQAQALLDLVLWQDGVGVRKAKFRMVEGDFKVGWRWGGELGGVGQRVLGWGCGRCRGVGLSWRGGAGIWCQGPAPGAELAPGLHRPGVG